MEAQEALKLLLLEDDADDAELLLRQFADYPRKIVAVVMMTRDDYVAALRRDWDIVVSDYILPQFDATEALALLQQSGCDCPFVAVSGAIGEEAAVALMRNGAADCISKANMTRLLPAIERALQERDNRRARQRAEQELERMAFYDELTNLPNRRYFVRELPRWTDGRGEGAAYLICIGMGRLRAIAATLGQRAADTLIGEVAARLGQLLPDGSLLSYFGCGDFVAAFRGQATAEHTAEEVRRMMRRLALPYETQQREISLNPVAGVCVIGDAQEAVDGPLRRARAALRQARDRNMLMDFFDRHTEQAMVRRLLLSQRLRGALQRDEFSLHYQPKVDLNSGRICGMEALLRWEDDELGTVPPDQFIPIAEECGVITEIGAWVIREVCRQMRRWRDADLPPLRVAVNVSVRQLRDPLFANGVRQALRDAHLPAAALELELTESDIMTDTDAAIAMLSELRALGVTITVDDFGTGYSSLSYLKRLPISTLKIDRSFIVDMIDDADSRAIVGAVVALAHSLRLKVVAEGVEEQAQVALLRDLACDEAQGYLFSRPLPVEGIMPLLVALGATATAVDHALPEYGVEPA